MYIIFTTTEQYIQKYVSIKTVVIFQQKREKENLCPPVLIKLKDKTLDKACTDLER